MGGKQYKNISSFIQNSEAYILYSVIGIFIVLAAFDLARCLNYAGMEALEWQGENPVIIPENTPVERVSKDGFMVIPKSQNLENGDTLQISISLPSDIWGKIESFWKKRTSH